MELKIPSGWIPKQTIELWLKLQNFDKLLNISIDRKTKSYIFVKISKNMFGSLLKLGVSFQTGLPI